jgi:hypothetical protein
VRFLEAQERLVQGLRDFVVEVAGQPGMVQCLLGGVAFVGFDFGDMGDEVLG